MIWFAVRTSSIQMDRSCRGMDILTLVIVMGQGVADIVVFGKSPVSPQDLENGHKLGHS